MGEGLEKIAFDDTTAGETFELYGPTNYSMSEIAELVDREIIKKRRHINIPKARCSLPQQTSVVASPQFSR